MPSDVTLDSLCSNGIAFKQDICIPCRNPDPYKALGVDKDTTFYSNSLTLYNINLMVAKCDKTTLILHPSLSNFSIAKKTDIEIILSWFGDIWAYAKKHGYTQNGGLVFMGSGPAFNTDMPYRAKHVDVIDNIDLLFALMGSIGTGRGKNLDFATGLNYLNEAYKKMVSESNIAGSGVLTLEKIKELEENGNIKDESNKKNEWILSNIESVEYEVNELNIAIVISKNDTLFSYAPYDTIRENRHEWYRHSETNTAKGIRHMIDYPARDTIFKENMSDLGNGFIKRDGSLINVKIWWGSDRTLYFINKNTGDTIPTRKYQHAKDK